LYKLLELTECTYLHNSELNYLVRTSFCMRNWRLVNHKMVHYHTSSQAPLLRYVCNGRNRLNTYKPFKKKMISAISNVSTKNGG